MRLMKYVRLLLAVVACTATVAASAQDTYPSRPIKIVVGFSAGSSADIFARLYALKLSEVLNNNPVIVENRPGAASLVAIRAVQAAPPDGYTLFISGGSAMSQGPGLRTDLPYDPLKDFTIISYLADLPGALIVNPSLGFKTVSDLIAYAKANPGKLNYGTSGVGSAGHLTSELFMARTGTKMTHIPYKADTEAAKEVIAGTLQVAFTTLRTGVSLANEGKATLLLNLSPKKLPELTQAPSVADAGVSSIRDIAPYSYYTLLAPAKMPAALVRQLNEASRKVTAMPDFLSKMQDAGIMPQHSTPEAARQFIESEITKWRAVGKTVKIDF